MIRAWHADAEGARPVDPDAAVRVALSGPGAAWLDFDGEEREVLERVLEPLRIHPLTIEDMVMELNRPKVDNFGPYLYLVVHSARWEPDDRPALREIDVVIGERFLVTYHEGAEIRPYLRDVYDRLARVSDLLDSFRDEVAGLLELNVSMVSNRLNQVIKVLTVIATLGLPLTVVTSYYGMNFQLAVYRWRYGEIYVLALLAVLLGGTWWFLRRRRWF